MNGAADFDAMTEMFLFEQFHLFGVGMVSVLLSALALWFLRKRQRAADGTRIRFVARPVHRGTVYGAILFGLGWGVSGACPGTALVQLGQGHLIALATVMGILSGMVAHGFVHRRWLRWPIPSCA